MTTKKLVFSTALLLLSLSVFGQRDLSFSEINIIPKLDLIHPIHIAKGPWKDDFHPIPPLELEIHHGESNFSLSILGWGSKRKTIRPDIGVSRYKGMALGIGVRKYLIGTSPTTPATGLFLEAQALRFKHSRTHRYGDEESGDFWECNTEGKEWRIGLAGGYQMAIGERLRVSAKIAASASINSTVDKLYKKKHGISPFLQVGYAF